MKVQSLAGWNCNTGLRCRVHRNHISSRHRSRGRPYLRKEIHLDTVTGRWFQWPTKQAIST
jgi:hypothetical protein